MLWAGRLSRASAELFFLAGAALMLYLRRTCTQRINHSCQPNCRIDFDSVSRVLYIRAVVPIAEGDEIFIPYVDMRQLTRERRTMLGHVFNFRCTCPTCSLPVAKLAESDANRKRLREFEEVHARWKAGKTSGRMVMIEGIELLRKGGIFDQEGLFGNPSRMNYWCLLFDVAAAHSSYVDVPDIRPVAD